MLRNSCIFDKSGNVKVTRENQDTLVSLSTFDAPQKLSDVVRQLTAKVDKFSTSNTMLIFCLNNGYKMPTHPLPHLTQLFRIRACYLVEKKCLQTSWNEELTTPLKSITKIEQKIINILKCKNTNLYNEKVNAKLEIEKEIEHLKKLLDNLDISIETLNKNISHMSMTNPFIKKCYTMANQDNTNKMLYNLLDKREKEQYKKCIGSDREKFDYLEQWKGKKVERNLALSNLKDIEHKHSILIRSIEELLSSEVINCDIEEKEEVEVVENKLENIVVPDSWEDY
jgi:hypothetical protein